MSEPIPFGKFLRLHRRAAEDSQEYVAGLAGLTQATLSRIEHGKLAPPPEAMRGLAVYLGIPISQIRTMVERSNLEAERMTLEKRLAAVDERLRALG